MNIFDEIKLAESQVLMLREDLLVKLGWAYRCDYPDSCWRWSKTFGDKTMTLSAKEAVDLEERIAP